MPTDVAVGQVDWRDRISAARSVTGTWVGATVAAVLLGGVLTLLMARVGLRQVDGHPSPLAVVSSLPLGAAAGVAAAVIAHRAGDWTLLPAMIIWAGALAAAAVCDAVTKRVPTGLVRQALVVVAVLLAVGLGVHSDWAALAISVVAALASAMIMLACWRFVGAGFGDVRLAALGGLGLGHATAHGLFFGFAALVAVGTIQVVIVLARGGNRRAQISLGPALAAGFIVAATA